MDEVGFGDKHAPGAAYGTIETGHDSAFMVNMCHRTHISVLVTTSACGTGKIPPMIIYKKSLPMGDFQAKGPLNALHVSTKSGFSAQQLTLRWLKEIFIPYAPAERPLVLIWDNASCHTGINIVDTCHENNIIIVFEPSQSSHLLQVQAL